VAAVLGIVPFALHTWAALRGGFAQDDFLITYRAAAGGPFDLDYLFQDYQGHLAPGVFLVAWVMTFLAPLNHAVMTVPLLLVQAAASVLFWLALVRCFGRRWAILVPFAVFTTSTLLLVPTLWWAYGIQILPVLLAATGALYAHAGYLRDGRRGQLIASAVWTVVGLAFYEKAALIPVLVLGMTVLVGAPLRRYRLVWLSQGGLLLLYALAYLLLTSSQVRNGTAERSVVGVLELFRRMVVDTLLPGLVGGPWSGPGAGATWVSPPAEVRAVLVFFTLAVLAWGVRAGGRRAWRAWALLGVAVVVDVGLVAVTRFSEVGPALGNDPRYVADIVLVAAFCGAFAFLRPVLLATEPEDVPAKRERPVVLGLSAALLLSSVVGFQQLAPAMRFDHASRYIDNARAAVAGDPELILFDAPVPTDIVHEWFAENSRASRVVGLVPGIRFDTPTSRMHVLDESGRPQRITGVDPIAVSVPGPVEGCGNPVADLLVRIPLDKAVLGRYLLRVDYYTAAGGEGVVDRDGYRTPVWFQEGLHSIYLPVEGLFDKIGVQLASKGAPVCIAKLYVGRPTT